MNKTTKKVFSYLLIATLAFSLLPIFHHQVKAQDSEDLIIRLSGGDFGLPSPYHHYSRGPGSYKMALLFDSLLERGEEGLIPWLASEYEVSDDGTVYKFKLRNNIKWHDGEDLTTEDIAFTFSYYDKHTPVWDNLKLHEEYLEEVKVIDDLHIEITVKEPNATLLDRFGKMKIIPKHIWENVDDPIEFIDSKAVIGSGPYKLETYEPELGTYKFVSFSDYWGPTPSVSAIEFIPVSDSILAFEREEIDLITIDPDLLDRYKDDERFEVVLNPAFWGYDLLLNMDKCPELQDITLRQAMMHAIDREELIEKIGRGIGTPGSPGHLPVEHQLYNQNLKQYDFDFDKATELLEGQEYEFDLLVINNNSAVRIAELLKLNFEKIGIKLNVIAQDMKTADARVREGDYELTLTGHGGWGNDADLLRTKYHSTQGSTLGYENQELDELLEKQLRAINSHERADLIYEIQEKIALEIPSIALFNTTSYTVFRPEKYDGWKHVFEHHSVTHNKISFVNMEEYEEIKSK